MSSTVVDGLVLPVAVGGHPALDFCNTRAGWGAPTPKEYLQSYQHLVVWTREAGLLEAARVRALAQEGRDAPAKAHKVLGAALSLREAAYSIVLGSRSETSFGVVNAQLRAARSAATLLPAGDTPGPVASWVLAETGLDAPLHAVAAQLDNLLCSPPSNAVAACPGEGCGWVFADARRRRRWCDMAVCGNRAKARRHAQRLAAR